MNVELAEEVLSYIHDHPEEHDQNQWGERTACGTSMCFAGHAALLAFGAENIAWTRYVNDPDAEAAFIRHVKVFGTHMSVGDAAQKALGLEDWQRTELFLNAMSLEEVELCIDAFKRGVSRDDFDEVRYPEDSPVWD